MDWETQYQAWRREVEENELSDLPERLILRATRKACHAGGVLDTPESWQWANRALDGDDERKWFVAHAFNSYAAPNKLGERFLDLGIAERSPSANRWFIEPAFKTLGSRRVYERLQECLDAGSDLEKAGAASAFYWIRDDRDDPDRKGVAGRVYDSLLRTFVETQSVDVRRRTLPLLSMKPEDYSPALRPLVSQAIQIARRDPDEYLRHRIEVQLGASGPFKAIPTGDGDGTAKTEGSSLFPVALALLGALVLVVAFALLR